MIYAKGGVGHGNRLAGEAPSIATCDIDEGKTAIAIPMLGATSPVHEFHDLSGLTATLWTCFGVARIGEVRGCCNHAHERSRLRLAERERLGTLSLNLGQKNLGLFSSAACTAK